MDEIDHRTDELLRSDEKARRDHAVALELYDLAERIAKAHPRIAKSLRQSAEQLIRLNEYRMEGVAIALRASWREAEPA